MCAYYHEQNEAFEAPAMNNKQQSSHYANLKEGTMYSKPQSQKIVAQRFSTHGLWRAGYDSKNLVHCK